MECFLPHIDVLLRQLGIFYTHNFHVAVRGTHTTMISPKCLGWVTGENRDKMKKTVIVKAESKKGFINRVLSTHGLKEQLKPKQWEERTAGNDCRSGISPALVPFPCLGSSTHLHQFTSWRTGTIAHSNALQADMERHLFSKKEKKERKMKVQEKHSNFLTLIFFLPFRGLGSEGLNLSQL